RGARRPSRARAAMPAPVLPAVVEPAAIWYSAVQALWAGLGILLLLLALQGWRSNGGTWRLVLGASWAVAAAAFWSGGYAAGPTGLAYLWADGRPHCRRAAAVPILATALAALVLLGLGGREVLMSGVAPGGLRAAISRPVRGILHTCQAIPEALVLGNLGLDATTAASQGVILTAAGIGLWAWSRRRAGRPNPLEATGFALVIISFLMVYIFRGDLHFDFLRAYGWYDAIPQVGAVLFAAGWWTALRTPLRPKRPL